jgi:hypothetical protein
MRFVKWCPGDGCAEASASPKQQENTVTVIPNFHGEPSSDANRTPLPP